MQAAYYEVIETEAAVVRQIFALYTITGLSIGAIARQLSEKGITTQRAGDPSTSGVALCY